MPDADKTKDSPLVKIPTPREIRDQLIRNAEENRNLRSLYKIAVRVHGLAPMSQGAAHAS